jgi:hypothetical protein
LADFALTFQFVYQMDKSWISNNSVTNEDYIRGILSFLSFAFANSSENGKIFCPCTKCANVGDKRSHMNVYQHIINHGFLKGYIRWIFHGEKAIPSNPQSTSEVEHEFHHDMDALIHDAFPIHTNNGDDEYTNIEDMDPGAFTSEHNVQQSEEGDDSDKFYKLLKEAEQNLYPGVRSSPNYPSSYTCTT